MPSSNPGDNARTTAPHVAVMDCDRKGSPPRGRTVRIVQFSDTHISHLGGTPSENMSLLVDFLNEELRPDLVIHTGDVVILNPDSPDDRQAAWQLLRQINAPLLVLPGNHDVGESGDDVWMDISVTCKRVADFAGTWGADRFLRLGDAETGSQDRAFIGINSERMSSGLPELAAGGRTE